MKENRLYKGHPQVQKALDALEILASAAPDIHRTIIEKVKPSQADELQDKFRQIFGDPAQMIIIGGSSNHKYMVDVLPKVNLGTFLELNS